jgi:peptidoglycan/LPS O-acetylase OafA/YrhL
MSDRVRYLDGLRGVLAVIVFVHHFFYAFCPEFIFGGPYPEFLRTGPYSFYKLIGLSPVNILFNPGTAIHFFFLLSGYVQTYNYFHKPDLVFLQKSFLKRYFRLAIPTLVVVLIVYAFHKFNLYTKELIPKNPVTSDWVKAMMPDNLNFFQVLKHGVASCFASNSKYYQVLWTMPTELYNSWMILILLFITHNLKNKTWLFVFWIIVQLFILEAFYSVAFTFGMLICSFEKNSLKFRSIFSNPLVKLFCLLVGIYFASYPFVGYQGSTQRGFYSPISFFEKYPHLISYLFGDLLLFCFILHSDSAKKLFSKKIVLFFGNISYMVYLTHLFLLLSFSPWLYAKLAPHVGYNLNLLLTGVISFGVITLVSLLLYLRVDKPVIKYCSIYTKKFFDV